MRSALSFGVTELVEEAWNLLGLRQGRLENHPPLSVREVDALAVHPRVYRRTDGVCVWMRHGDRRLVRRRKLRMHRVTGRSERRQTRRVRSAKQYDVSLRPMAIPPDIDDALLALGRQSGISSVLRSLERSLDMAVSGAFQRSPPYPADVTKTFDLLRQCLSFAGFNSAGPGDELELPRLQQLAAILEARLAPPSAPPPAPAAIAREPGVRKAGPPAATRPARRRLPVTPARVNPARVAGLVGAILSKLANLYELRQRLLVDPLATWRDFQAMDRQMKNSISAVEWLAGAATEPAQTLLATAEEEADGFAAALALLRAGGHAELLVGPLGVASLANGVLAAIRLSGQASAWQEIATRAPEAPSTTAVRLSALADRGELAADILLDLLDHDSDAVAIRAAELLPWVGRPPADARDIEDRLRRGIAETRFFPFLYAAIVLGSSSSLDELRRRMDAGEPVTGHAVDAIACAGGPHDGERLLKLAARDEALAPAAVLAAGYLGERRVAAALAAGVEPKAVAERALRTIVGATVEGAAGSGGGRLLYGKPWTLSGALARLDAPDELLCARRWLALEVAVRTGVRPPVVVDVATPGAVQEAALARLRAAIEPRGRSIPAGAWFYFGRPAAA